MTSTIVMQEAGFLSDAGKMGNRMTDSNGSLTDITLEQAALKLQEIERENMALKDNLRTHNAIVKKQYDALAEWRKKENDKFEQTKALITSLRADNQDLQVKVMTLTDKEKELTQQVQSIEEEKAHIQRQKALSDQRLFNLYNVAKERGVEGLVQEELKDAQDIPDAVLLASASVREEIISKLETALASKEEMIAQLRADILKRDQEFAKSRETTKQLLKDMESQQKLKESVEEENRVLITQNMQAEQKFHELMQANMATTKEQMASAATSRAASLKQEKFTDDDIVLFSFPKNVDDLVDIAKSIEAKQREEVSTNRLMKNLDEERKDKQILKEQIDKLEKELQEMTIKQEEKHKELEEAQQRAAETADKLAQEYERKLMEVAKISSTPCIQASDSEDVSILRSQVLALLREVDEAQNKLSAAIAALHHKDSKIMELDQMNQSLRKEYNDHWQETHGVIQNLQSQVRHQQKSQQENSYIKNQHEQLQQSFSKLVIDYKELQETFEAYQMQMQASQAPKQQRKDVMEEINRLTAQVIAADEAIAQRDDQLAILRNQTGQSCQQEEKIQLLQFQADLYRADFTAEREARNKLAEDKNSLAEENSKLIQTIHYLQEQNRVIIEEVEGYNHGQIYEMQRRFQGTTANFETAESPRLRATPPLAQDYRHHMQNFRQQDTDTRNQAQNYRLSTQNYPEPGTGDYQTQSSSTTPMSTGRDEEELPSFQELECPSCNARFPDIDSLQLHVTDCIDNR